MLVFVYTPNRHQVKKLKKSFITIVRKMAASKYWKWLMGLISCFGTLLLLYKYINIISDRLRSPCFLELYFLNYSSLTTNIILLYH